MSLFNNQMQFGEIDRILAHIKEGNYPSRNDLNFICNKATEIFQEYPNVVSVPSPVTICGDTHGQFYDLLELFALGGDCPDTNYLFLGDYVDRGYYSIETFSYLLCLKIRYPNRITLLRGNHETRQTTQAYGFYDEIMRKYNDAAVWNTFCDLFDLLPLCALVDNKIFCVHGGLSPNITSIEQIQSFNRKREVPDRGPICDLLWSDPETITGFQTSPRGAGYIFGDSAVTQFNRANKLKLICRAHQLAMEGYVEWFDKKLFTVWSAPNYCYRGGNPASILEVDTSLDTRWKLFDPAPPQARGDFPDRTTVNYFM